jgi:hypothetical protein
MYGDETRQLGAVSNSGRWGRMVAGAVELSLAWQNNKGAAAAVFGGEGEALREVVH